MKQKNKVPKDWVESKLIQCVDINKENLSDKNDKNIKFYYIDLSSVDKGTINLPLNKIDFINAPVRARRIINKDDILFSTVRPYLKGFAYISFETNKEWIVSTGFAVLTAKKNIISKYIYQYLFLDKFLKQIETCLLGSSYPALNSSDIENLIITYPIGVKEQEKIVEILELWDKAIETTKKLIEQKKLQKKYLMQKLLTGKIRLKGFKDKWKKKSFGDIFDYERPDNYISKLDNYSNKYTTPVLTANKAFILGYTNENRTYNKHSIIFDDFTLESKYVDFPYMVKSSAIKILTTKSDYDLYFSFNLLNFTKLENLGHARHYISIVQSTKILVPTNIAEQKAIADILSTADKQIDLLKQKLSKLELQKKGLMQKLLTGEIRVC